MQRLKRLLRTVNAIRLAGRETPMFDSPFPASVWRAVSGTPVPDPVTGEHEPAQVVIGLPGVMQDPQAPELPRGGMAWRGAEGHRQRAVAGGGSAGLAAADAISRLHSCASGRSSLRMRRSRENKHVSFAGVVAGGSNRAVALALGLGALTGSAHAQFDRLKQEIELTRLDHHPQGSFRREPDLRIRGNLDAAVRVGQERTRTTQGCETWTPPRVRMGRLLASELGVVGSALLDGGWWAQVELAHGFELAQGASADDCGRFFDRAALVGIGHRSYGSAQLGRREQPAWGIALMADPFGGSSVASPGDEAYYVPPAGPGGRYRVRTGDAVTLVTPYHPNGAAALQGSVNSKGDAERGGAVRWRHGSWQLGAGWQRWNDKTRAVPVAATAQLGHWRASVGITWGRWDGRPYRNVLVGLAVRERSGAHPGEFLVALNRHDRDAAGAGADGWQLGLGYVYPLSRRTTLRAELAVVDPDGRATRTQAGIGIRHSFAL